MFRSLGLDTEQQRRVLLWGVLGAIVMRALFIVVGASLLARFEWIEYVFGAFLLIAAIRLLRHKPGEPAPSAPCAGCSKAAVFGHRLERKLALSPFLLIVLAVEATDLIFALDSIPAVLAISRATSSSSTRRISSRFSVCGRSISRSRARSIACGFFTTDWP